MGPIMTDVGSDFFGQRMESMTGGTGSLLCDMARIDGASMNFSSIRALPDMSRGTPSEPCTPE